jgi:transcriptional regulator with XRE-family HTH domain
VEQARRKEEQRSCQNRSTLLPFLRELHQSKGLSQRELGRLAGVSAGTVFRLENQVRGGYPVTVRKLSAALGVPSAELVREDHRR